MPAAPGEPPFHVVSRTFWDLLDDDEREQAREWFDDVHRKRGYKVVEQRDYVLDEEGQGQAGGGGGQRQKAYFRGQRR
jgi:hypothetical protein